MAHKHHIIPRHAGGTNDPSNLIEVTIEEHALIHYNLWQLEGRWQDELAWKMLSGQIGKEEGMRLANSLGHKDKRLSQEHKQKISMSLKGRPKSEEWKRWRRTWRRPQTEETKEKLRQANIGKNTWSLGKSFSEEHKRKLSEARKKWWGRQNGK